MDDMWSLQTSPKLLILILIASWTFPVLAHQQSYLESDDDLLHFVSRPDLKPPKFNVHSSNPEKLSPGYWFIAPYTDLKPTVPSKQYTPYQIGPHIYDNKGELVWSGAHLFKDRQTFDFRLTQFNNSPALSFILYSNSIHRKHPYGALVILDDSFQIHETIETTLDGKPKATNMHEFKVLHDNSALLITGNSTLVELLSTTGEEVLTWISNNGFREIDVLNNRVLFEWWALDHLDPHESYARRTRIAPTIGDPLDLFHLNSVDKTQNGDFIISCRFTSTIYRVSGVDGSIIWRLGGKNSSFTLLDFDFSNQHDARWHSDDGEATFLTFMNNGANSMEKTRNFSSANYVKLDLVKRQATCLTELPRPDGQFSRLRGNTQLLSDGNYFVGWSDNSVISEFASDGHLLLNASFTSSRFVTYRSYKFDFVGRPIEKPALKVFNYGTSKDYCITTCYVSLNGATEIALWKFFSAQQGHDDASSSYLGSVNKTTFESAFIAQGCHPSIRVEAIDSEGHLVAQSNIVHAEVTLFQDQMRNQLSGSSLANDHDSDTRPSDNRITSGWNVSALFYKCFLLSVTAAVAFSCGRWIESKSRKPSYEKIGSL